ncbi:MAG: thiamine phosphate synthase [Terriglobales bacterium]
MLLYYITDRSQFAGDETSRRRKVLEKVAEAAKWGVDFIQLREKDLFPRELVALAQEAIQLIRKNSGTPTQLLINSRTDIAIAAGARGVHLRSVDISPKDVREIWSGSTVQSSAIPVITVACHNIDNVIRAATDGAGFALFGPVFEKRVSEKRKESQSLTANATPTGLDLLREACLQEIPVIALGGVTSENARRCTDAGAAGVAGIRLFQENPVGDVVQALHN